MIVRTRQGETIDALCWRYYGRTNGAVEAVLEANANLADIGVVLPVGTLVEMPDIKTIVSTKPLVQLFD